ncbi:TPA: hypothetical protein DCR49_00225 [Candidatus Delongbacteria bacterium]|nr:hypothetical protein [Candidatus Delongbacteria bacterium]
MDLYTFVMPLGVITYILIVLAILTGKRIIKLKPVWHRIIAVLTLIFASLHAAIVISYNL